MEGVAADGEAFHLRLGDFDAFFVDLCGEGALVFEPGLGRCRRDEVDDGRVVRELPAALVLRDAAEQAVLDLVPFRCAGRTVPDLDREARLTNVDRARPASNRPLPSVAELPADQSCKCWYHAAPHRGIALHRVTRSQGHSRKTRFTYRCSCSNQEALDGVTGRGQGCSGFGGRPSD